MTEKRNSLTAKHKIIYFDFNQHWTLRSCSHVCTSLHVTVTHNAAQNITNNFLYDPVENLTTQKLTVSWNGNVPIKSQHDRLMPADAVNAVTDHRPGPQCCHQGSYLRPSRPWMQEIVPCVHCLQWVFLHAKPKAACAPHCLNVQDGGDLNSDVKSVFFRNPDIHWCNPDKIRISSFSRTQLCDCNTHIYSPPPTVWAGKCKPHQRLDTRRGTKWPFPLSSLSASNLAQFDLVSIRLRVIREAQHSSAYSRKSHTQLQSERQQGRFYGNVDGSIILLLLAACAPDW